MFGEISCPNCGAPGLESRPDDHVVCRYCGNVFAESGTFCPNCRHVNRKGSIYCENCGEPLTRACPACEARNWSGAEYCHRCGRALDILAYIAERHKQTTAERLRESREIAGLVKTEEEAGSQRRMQQLWEVERQRQRGLAEAVARQRARDRRMIEAVVAGVLLFGCLLALAGVLLAMR